MAAPENNRNAAHGNVTYTTRLQVPMTEGDKACYTTMAGGKGKLPALVRSLLEQEYGRINGVPKAK